MTRKTWVSNVVMSWGARTDLEVLGTCTAGWSQHSSEWGEDLLSGMWYSSWGWELGTAI